MVIHELGHIIALFILGHGGGVPLPRMPGFSIKVRATLSYKEDIVVAAAGPLANLITALILLPLGQVVGAMIIISVLTAISNLLPVRGYDGYRILTSAIAISGTERFFGRLPDALSFVTAMSAVLLSLYFIYAFDAGYWIFGVFFIFLLGEVKKSLK
jgi:Zn-dependent protease